MKKLLYFSIIALQLFLHTGLCAQHTMVNTKWTSITGSVGQYDWSSTSLDSQHQLCTTGNKVASGQGTNISTIRYNADGSVAWQSDWNGATNGDDYGTAIATNANHVFVCGATFNVTNNDFDYVVLKYDIGTGALVWSYIYADPAGGLDIPSDIALDDQGNVFVTGVRQGATTLADYCTLALNNSGTLLWSQFYDYANSYELAAKIVVNSDGDCIVTGGSGNSWTDGDFCSVWYSATGTQLGVKRSGSVTTYFDQPLDVKKDASDNIYVVGRIGTSGNGEDIKLMKMDEELNIVWSVTKDGYGHNDLGQSVVLDDSGNIYVAGYFTTANNHKEAFLLKYNNSGVLQWQQTISSAYNGNSLAWKITYNEGFIYLVGDIDTDLGQDALIAVYNQSGQRQWMKTIDGGNGGDDSGRHMEVGGDNFIYMSGQADLTEGKRYLDSRFEKWERTQTVLNNADGEPIRFKGELIVHFAPDVMNLTTVDDKGKIFGDLGDFINQTALNSLNAALGVDLKYQKAIKVYKRMTTADNVSIDRLGNTVGVDKHWSSIVVTLPATLNDVNAFNTISALFPIVEYVSFNSIFHLDDIPNDDLIGQQESLIPSTQFPNAHINADAAWDIETGKNYIKVGIYDDVIYWAHEDFGDGTFTGSKIVGGWDWAGNQAISNVTAPNSSHGTACAGVIGALRNNNLGIAGIAGGDVNGTGSTGVQLFSMGIFGNNGFSGLEDAADAIVEGAVSNGDFGYGLHVQNHSWGGNTNDAEMLAALKTAYRNKCVVVASRGNDGNDGTNFPASYNDEYVISVGASGNDGTYKTTDNGDSWWASSFGGGVDLIAPGSTDIVRTTVYPLDDNDIDGSGSNCTNDDALYNCFNGTSSAAPHVSGVVGLMLSKHNTAVGAANNLSPEDVEYVVQMYANDIEGTFNGNTYPAGYDEKNGYGLLDASESLAKISGQYRVFHSAAPASSSQSTFAGLNIILNQNINGVAAGWYVADRVQVIHTYLNVLPPTTSVLAAWSRYSDVIGVSAANPVTGATYGNYQITTTANVASVVVTTYCWHILTTSGGQNVDVWIPAHPSELQTPYSLHLYDSTPIAITETEVETDLVAFPNPANEQIQFAYTGTNVWKNAELTIYNSLGQLVDNITWSFSSSPLVVDTNKYGSGVYICKFRKDNIEITRRIIIE
jgi:hypothetical protein